MKYMLTNKSLKQKESWEMYCLETRMHNHMLDYVQNVIMSKDVWSDLRKLFATNTIAHKL